MEEWRVIPGFPSYEASTLGRIRRITPTCNTPTTRILKPTPNHGGYSYVTLHDNGRRYNQKGVHQLIALTFLGPIPEGLEVLHKDDDKNNCRQDNLEYGTKQKNTLDRDLRGRGAKGSRIAQAKVVETQVLEIKRRYAKGATIAQLARESILGEGAISSIVHGRTWKHVVLEGPRHSMDIIVDDQPTVEEI